MAGQYEALGSMITAIAVERGGFGGFRSWLGPIADLGDGAPHLVVARRMGLDGPLASGALRKIGHDEARRLLAFLAHDSMVHTRGGEAPEVVLAKIDAGLAALGAEATFRTNGCWGELPAKASWTPLTAATFDTGLIGCAGPIAFLIWMEGED